MATPRGNRAGFQAVQVPAKFRLVGRTLEVLNLCDDYEMGVVTRAEIFEKMKDATLKKEVLLTVSRIASSLQRQGNAQTQQDYQALMAQVLQLLALANQPAPPPESIVENILRMPTEIQLKIVGYMVDVAYRPSNWGHRYIDIRLRDDVQRCACVKYQPRMPVMTRIQKAMIPRLVKLMPDVFFEALFARTRVCFSCTCEMKAQLETHPHLFQRVSNIQVPWLGHSSDKAFSLLATCPRIEKLTVIVSFRTYRYYSDDMLRYQKGLGSVWMTLHKQTRIIDCRGFKELLNFHSARPLKFIEFVPTDRTRTEVAMFEKFCRSEQHRRAQLAARSGNADSAEAQDDQEAGDEQSSEQEGAHASA